MVAHLVLGEVVMRLWPIKSEWCRATAGAVQSPDQWYDFKTKFAFFLNAGKLCIPTNYSTRHRAFLANKLIFVHVVILHLFMFNSFIYFFMLLSFGKVYSHKALGKCWGEKGSVATNMTGKCPDVLLLISGGFMLNVETLSWTVVSGFAAFSLSPPPAPPDRKVTL